MQDILRNWLKPCKKEPNLTHHTRGKGQTWLSCLKKYRMQFTILIIKEISIKRALPIRTIMISHTIADVFWVHLKGYSQALNRKKRVSAFRAKKEGICFEVAYTTKNLGLRISVALLLSCMEIKRTRKFKLYKLISKPLGDQTPHIYTRPICLFLPPHLNLRGAYRYLCQAAGGI